MVIDVVIMLEVAVVVTMTTIVMKMIYFRKNKEILVR